MTGLSFIFSRLLEAGGYTPYQAQCIEPLFVMFLIVPVIVGLPMLLAEWDKFKRADNARIRVAKRRRMERTAR